MEIACFQQHISACSVDKVNRNWLMDVFEYTQCIFQILVICSWLACVASRDEIDFAVSKKSLPLTVVGHHRQGYLKT